MQSRPPGRRGPRGPHNTLACGARFVHPREDTHKENLMNQIVKAETAPTMSQATTSASVLIALIVVLAGLGMTAALQVGSIASTVLAVVVALTALIVSPAILSIARMRA